MAKVKFNIEEKQAANLLNILSNISDCFYSKISTYSTFLMIWVDYYGDIQDLLKQITESASYNEYDIAGLTAVAEDGTYYAVDKEV